MPNIVCAWNAAHSLPFAAILEPVMWETHARPELGDRPQALINKQLVDHCDILVGTFWTRLGTSTGKAESGTAEEIEEFRAKGKPVLLYFSSAPVVPESLDPAQYKALTEYKDKLGKQGLYFRYESLEQLNGLLQGHLAGVMAQIHSRPTVPTTTEVESKDDQLHEFRAQFESFLRRLDSEWVSERDSEPMSTSEGKSILANALDQLHIFRSQIIDGLDSVKKTLDETSRELRTLQRHQLFMDGGRSFNEFWKQGDAILEKLKSIPANITE